MKYILEHRKILIRVGILGVLLLLSIVMLQKVGVINSIYEEQQAQERETERAKVLQEQGVELIPEPGEDQVFTISVQSQGNKDVKSGASTLIKWWYREEDGKYYLFLPSSANLKNLKFHMSIVDKIYIDGNPVKEGDTFGITVGDHEITTDYSDQVFPLVVMQSQNTATVFFETDSGSLQYLHTDKSNMENGKVTVLHQNGDIDFTGEMEEIHCRGNASWTDTDKKSYLFKLPGKESLLGMGTAKKWILIGNAFDDTLIRNITAMDMAEKLKLKYTPKMKMVDVYGNGNFLGSYLLSEKVEIGESRVAINNLEKETEKMNPSLENLSTCEFFMTPQGRLYSTKGYRIPNEPADISGGYLLEIEMSDRYGLEASGFMTSRMQPLVFASPKYASFDQVSYIANMYQDFEDAIYSQDGYSPYTGKYYEEYIDVESFARKYLLEEMVKNLDAAFTSQYIYKPNDKESTKFFAGPAWDYDKAIAGHGITQEGIDLFEPTGFYAAVQTKDSDYWYGLCQQESFMDKVKEIYFDEFQSITEEEASTLITQRAETICDANMMNAYRWNMFQDEETIEGKTDLFYQHVGELSDFLQKRNAFLTEEWSQ